MVAAELLENPLENGVLVFPISLFSAAPFLWSSPWLTLCLVPMVVLSWPKGLAVNPWLFPYLAYPLIKPHCKTFLVGSFLALPGQGLSSVLHR